ncbi:MAG TPA: biopolymer transporter ExbD [Patescibacteria group bacterium]|jgi:biopolymer transport protein ExbD|nr:biopolymer transporter ExbD [Patescibacteria group bacterium]
MKFPRNARIFRGQLDAAPFAAVFFLLVIFLMLGSLMYTPGVRLELPLADELPGTDRPTVSVAIDSGGRFYYDNQLVQEKQLGTLLRQAVLASSEPLTLVVQADRSVSTEMVVRMSMLARSAGITNGLLATLPRPTSTRQAKAVP